MARARRAPGNRLPFIRARAYVPTIAGSPGFNVRTTCVYFRPYWNPDHPPSNPIARLLPTRLLFPVFFRLLPRTDVVQRTRYERKRKIREDDRLESKPPGMSAFPIVSTAIRERFRFSCHRYVRIVRWAGGGKRSHSVLRHARTAPLLCFPGADPNRFSRTIVTVRNMSNRIPKLVFPLPPL